VIVILLGYLVFLAVVVVGLCLVFNGCCLLRCFNVFASCCFGCLFCVWCFVVWWFLLFCFEL